VRLLSRLASQDRTASDTALALINAAAAAAAKFEISKLLFCGKKMVLFSSAEFSFVADDGRRMLLHYCS
jgi:hypothetical protein